MIKKYKALIIGAGKMAAFFDKPKDTNILTHAHAYFAHKNFEIAGFVDVDLNKARGAAKVWGSAAFLSISDAYNNLKDIDVVSVCAPDEEHFKILKEIAKFQPKIVFCEKPITNSAKEAQEIISLYKKRDIALLINYSRRFVGEIQNLQKEIKGGAFGDFLSGSAYYGKGLVHNGSHMIDLIRLLVGEINSAEVYKKEADFFKQDASVSARLTLENNKIINLSYINCNNFSIFELDLFFEKGRVRLIDSSGKIERFKRAKSQIYKGYRYLERASVIRTSLGRAMYGAVENIYGFLSKKSQLSCPGPEAYRDLSWALKIQNQKNK